ncbi:hypothetical protein WN943_017616 [Citrus x changshan-huyou]
MTANALQGMQVSIVSILGLLVVRYSAFMRLNAWLYLKYIMLAIALLIGKESADCSLPTLSQTGHSFCSCYIINTSILSSTISF